MLKPDKTFNADVVVVGGGIAGCMASIRAKELLGSDHDVFLVDKGYVSRSGQSPFAAGILTAFNPDEDDYDKWMEEIVSWGEYLNDQNWCHKFFLESWPMVKRLDNYGMDAGEEVFRKDEKGKFIRRQSRGHLQSKHLLINALPMMKMLRERAMKIGVQVFDRVMVTDIVMKEGQLRGILGLSLREEKTCYFKSKTLILCASGSGFKATFIGHQGLTGDLQSAALEAGVQLRNLEQYASNTTAKDYDIHGLNLFVSIGGVFRNGQGEDFMPHYHPELGSRARLQDLALAFCREVMEGRGPIYLDMKAASRDDQVLCREICPETFMLWDRAGVKPFDEALEWIPSSYATLISGGGIHINSECETNLHRIYAAGDITCIPPHGTYSFGGVNMSFCPVSGLQAAESASIFCREVLSLPEDSEKGILSDLLMGILEPLDRPNRRSTHDFVRKVQQLIVPMEAGLLKAPNRLQACVEEADRLEMEELPNLGGKTGHELMRVLECRSMIRLAQAMVTASSLRTESRGFHFRQDYPRTDNVNWLKWIMISRKPGNRGCGGIDHRLEEVPTPYFRPKEDYSIPPGVRRS
jgi:succinate dehydrogenase / fumarate reductase, flavoprotein subunit